MHHEGSRRENFSHAQLNSVHRSQSRGAPGFWSGRTNPGGGGGPISHTGREGVVVADASRGLIPEVPGKILAWSPDKDEVGERRSGGKEISSRASDW